MFSNATTFTDQGNIGEARAILEFSKMNWKVSKPLFVNTKYDLIVDTGTHLLKVSVKTSRYKKTNGGFEVKISTSGGNTSKNVIKPRTKTDFDILFVVTSDGDCYMIPSEELCEARHSIVVGNSKYNNCKLT